MFFLVSCSDDDSDSITGSSDAATVRIGAILDCDEIAPIDGKSMLAALELAEKDINADATLGAGKTTIEFITKDSKGSITELMNAFAELADADIDVIMTPLTSAELFVIGNSAQYNGSILVSPTSTSTDLSRDDVLIRLLPDDNVQAAALAHTMSDAGIKQLFTLYRSDLWGRNLADNLVASFAANGGTAVPAIEYLAIHPEMDRETVMAELAASVTEALKTTDAKDIAVFIACFEEGIDFLTEAAKYPELANIAWYGADGFAKNGELLMDSEAASFAETVAFTASIFGEPQSAGYSAVRQRIAEKTGSEPYSLAMLLYDSAWIAAKAAVEADMHDMAAYKAKFLETSEAHEGLFGKAKMNENGDRVNGSFDFWTVTGTDGSYAWEKSATYEVIQ